MKDKKDIKNKEMEKNSKKTKEVKSESKEKLKPEQDNSNKAAKSNLKASEPSRFYYGLKSRITAFLIILALLIATAIISLLLAVGNMTIHTFTYNETSVLDYQVCYIENEFFEEECMPRGRQYVASLIDQVNTTFNYSFNGSYLFDFAYTYDVTATVIAYERGQPERILFKRTDTLLEERTNHMISSTGFEINEEIEVDYRYFNQIVNNFRQEYVLLMDSKIVVTLNINVEGVHPNITQPIEVNREVTIEIPLSEQTLDINISYEDVNSSYIIHSENDNEILSLIYYAIAAISTIFALAILVKLIKLISKATQHKSLYIKKLDKILKEYDLVIVDTKTMPEIEGQKLYEIPSMEELLDVQNVLQKPIMFYKIHDEKSSFTVSDGKEAYRYIMKAVDVEKEQSEKKSKR